MSHQRRIEHSQNFIRNSNLVKELLELTQIEHTDLVIEIGPGKGIITKELLKRAGRVIAIERDPQFSDNLLLLKKEGDFQLVIGDFLKWQIPRDKFKVFSNIPFNYTADIVNKLVNSPDNSPTDIYLIMQEAAAHRFIGAPYEQNSLISMLFAIDYTVNILRKISRDNFDPKPNITISFVHFSRRVKAPIPINEKQFFRDFVVFGYTKWAPTVLESFNKVFTKRQRLIIAKSQKLNGLKPTDLSIEQWINLYKSFLQYVDESKKNLVYGSEKRLQKQQSKLEKSYRTRERMD